MATTTKKAASSRKRGRKDASSSSEDEPSRSHSSTKKEGTTKSKTKTKKVTVTAVNGVDVDGNNDVNQKTNHFLSIQSDVLWTEKYRPLFLKDLDLHPNVTEKLQQITMEGAAIPHLIFHGPSGSGKRTRVRALLNTLLSTPKLTTLTALTKPTKPANPAQQANPPITTTLAPALAAIQSLSSSLSAPSSKVAATLQPSGGGDNTQEGLVSSSQGGTSQVRGGVGQGSGLGTGTDIGTDKVVGAASDMVVGMKVGLQTFRTDSKKAGRKTIQIPATWSRYHMELSPADAGVNDKIVMQQVVRHMARSKTTAIADPFQHLPRFIVIHEAHRLTKLAQHALRRTMEHYAGYTCLIFITDNLSALTPEVKSRCRRIPVPRPSEDDVHRVLVDTILQKEGIATSATGLSYESVVSKIIQRAGGNLWLSITGLQQYIANPKDGQHSESESEGKVAVAVKATAKGVNHSLEALVSETLGLLKHGNNPSLPTKTLVTKLRQLVSKVIASMIPFHEYMEVVTMTIVLEEEGEQQGIVVASSSLSSEVALTAIEAAAEYEPRIASALMQQHVDTCVLHLMAWLIEIAWAYRRLSSARPLGKGSRMINQFFFNH